MQVAVLLPAAVGRFSLWGAVFVDVGSSLLVVANALRCAAACAAQVPLLAYSTGAAHQAHQARCLLFWLLWSAAHPDGMVAQLPGQLGVLDRLGSLC